MVTDSSSKSRSARLAAAALVSATLAAAPVAAEPPTFGRLVVFGDSLSDNGNAGRFADGPVWVEHMAERMGVELRPSRLGGTNYAVGGALTHGGTNSLREQADDFLAGRRRGGIDAKALYVVWGGGNDLLAAMFDPSPGRIPRAAASAIAKIVADLFKAGAKHVLVPNLPDVGMTPAVRTQSPVVAAAARQLSLAFNEALERELSSLEAGDARLYRLDVMALAERVLADPGTAGFVNLATPCFGTGCEGFLFFDQVHPTAYAHRRLAAAALATIGLPAGG